MVDVAKVRLYGLPGMLADSLPDTYGKALFERWLALTGRTSGNPIESLCYYGKRCMGALTGSVQRNYICRPCAESPTMISGRGEHIRMSRLSV